MTITELAEEKDVRWRSFRDVVYITILTTEDKPRQLPWRKRLFGIKSTNVYNRDFEILRKLWLLCELLPCDKCREDFTIRLQWLTAVMEIYDMWINIDDTIIKSLPYPYNTIVTSQWVDWFQMCAVAHNNINWSKDRTKEKLIKYIKSERQFRLD